MRSSWPVLLLVVAALCAALRPWSAASAEDPPDVTPHPDITGWTAGPKAVGTAEVLQMGEPAVISLPPDVAERVTGPTALFYFSPSCPHCQNVMPEVNGLQGRAGLSWLGIASSRATPDEISAFAATYGATFPLVSDADNAFAQAVGARSTPIVLVVKPAPEDAGEALNAAVLPDAPKVLLTDAYQPYSRGLGPVLLMRQHPDAPFADFEGHQGDLVCSTCHQHEARSWALTHHSVAYRTLYSRGKAEDPECVSCHVTGMGDGGFVLGDHGSPFTDVTCESCHGPAGPHDGTPTDAEASCVGCHDEKHSVAFSLDKGMPHIDHFRDLALSDAQIQARLEALGSGTAEKPLLAFPDGPTVGSAACKSCHQEQHKWAKGDAHSKAMRHLDRSQRAEGCVRCHATPTAMSSLAPPDPTQADRWRMDEGVGCESCHGPGGDHVAAPAKGNIVGLGDSCPECVIEAICTSCHTEEWDPDWALEPRLGAIDH